MEKLHEYLPGDSRERIQDLLREKGMTQAQLAEKMNISGSSLNRYLSGETDKLSTENIVKMARVFGVSTDFLLCETNIPYRTNYDIEELGLSELSAWKLYTGEIDPVVVNLLLEHKEFALLAAQIAQFRDATVSAGIAAMNTMFTQLGKLAMKTAKMQPRQRKVAIRTAQDALAMRQPINTADTSAMEATFLRIVSDLRASADNHIDASKKLTTEAMDKLVTNVQKRGGSFKPNGMTAEQIVESILDTADPNVITEEHKKALRAVFQPLFTKPRKE